MTFLAPGVPGDQRQEGRMMGWIRYGLAFPLALIVALWDAVGDARREFTRTFRRSFDAITGDNHPDCPPDPSEGRGTGATEWATHPAARCPRLLVGMGGDTWDPECCLPLGHSGRCRPDA